MAEIDKPLSPEAHWAAWKADPTPQATGNLLDALDPHIENAARAHVGQVNPIVKGRARSMAVRAIQTYDPTRGAKLTSHLHNQLQGLKRFNAKLSAGVRTPERAYLDQRALGRAHGELRDTLGREPSEDELSDHTGLSAKRMRYVRQFAPAMSEGYFASLGEGGEGYRPPVQAPTSDAWLKVVREDLAGPDQVIFDMALGGASNNQIAAKLRLTPGAVSQRKLRIQQTIDQGDELNPFEG